MMSTMHNPAHPGEVLREFIPDGMTVTETAQRLGVSRGMLFRVLNRRSAMTANMAIRVGLLTRTTPESWLANQVQWDLWHRTRQRLLHE